MKKYFAFFLIILSFIICLNVNAEDTSIKVMYHGEPISFDTDAYYFNDRIMVPVRGIFEALGAAVFWDDEKNTATAVLDDTTVTLTLNQTLLTINGESFEMDVPVQMVSDRIHASARFVAESFGKKISYHEYSETAVISDKNEYEFYPDLKLPVPNLAFVKSASYESAEKAFNGGISYIYSCDENSLTDYLNFLQLDFGYAVYNMEYLENSVRYTYIFDSLKVSVTEEVKEDRVKIEVIPDVDRLYASETENKNEDTEPEIAKDINKDVSYDDADYGRITGSPLIDVYTDDGTDYYVYEYSLFAASMYESYIQSQGWSFYDFSMDIDTFSKIDYYKKGDATLCISVNHLYNLIIIAVL